MTSNPPSKIIINRNNEEVKFSRNHLKKFLESITGDFDQQWLDIEQLIDKVVSSMVENSTKDQFYDLVAETSAYCTLHHHYGLLAGRIMCKKLHKNTNSDYREVVEQLRIITDTEGHQCQMISDEVYNIVCQNYQIIQNEIKWERDMLYDFFAIKTLEKSYLLKDMKGKTIERPQHMFMRVALGIHGSDFAKAFRTYHLMSQKKFTHASPTMFNAGTPRCQMSSCFLLPMEDDSIEGIYKTLKKAAIISKYSGGVGLSISNIRATGSTIKGTGGESTGLMQLLRVFNNTARYINQGGGKRLGSFAVYLEPWHLDVVEFLKLRKNFGKEEERARDLFYGLWIPDLFMERVKNNDNWTLFSPDSCPDLQDLVGEAFRQRYEEYEGKSSVRRQIIGAQFLLKLIMESQIETGTPYMLFKDACNLKSNQKNLGTIRSSNLCTEIIEYNSKDEIAVCNLASICIKEYATFNFLQQKWEYDHEGLHALVKVITENLNIIIEKNFYPLEECRRSNFRHRPIGLGVQGLADLYAKMGMPFESDDALKLGKEIFETIYHAGLQMSMEIAKDKGHYETYKGSPISEGKFQFDLWQEFANKPEFKTITHSGRYDWDVLRKDIMNYGVRNSLIFAPMPTAATAQIMGNNESIEAFVSNCYLRRVLSGEFIYINKYLVDDLVKIGAWDEGLRQEIMNHNGSIQNINGIPDSIKKNYKTVYEMKQRRIVEMAAHRGVYVDQSQSLNIYFDEPSYSKLTSLHLYTWSLGLKTGMYYLRTKGASNAIKFTVDQNQVEESMKLRQAKMDNGDFDVCIGCGA